MIDPSPMGPVRGSGSPAPDRRNLTSILRDVRTGDEGALDQLVEAVYAELQTIGSRHLKGYGPDQALQPTAIVHEAYLKLLQQETLDWQSRAQFFAIAGRLIRRVLVDAVRRRVQGKQECSSERPTLSDVRLHSDGVEIDLLALDRVLDELAEIDPVAAQVVELRFFADQSPSETASVLDTSERSVRRHFAYAKAWIHRRLEDRKA